MSEPRGWRNIPIGALPYKLSLDYRTGSWRAERPVIDYGKCTKCLICWLFCPEPSIIWDGKDVVIDYDYCKGCGICAYECPVKAIKMVPEYGVE